MKKTITLTLVFLILISTVVAKAAPEIVYDGTSVIVKGDPENANTENPVAILILSPDEDGNERSAAEIEEAGTTEEYNSILEYIGITTLDDEGSFGSEGYKINLGKSLPSGNCAVYINHIGKNELERIGGFYHVNAEELNKLVEKFNKENADYTSLLSEDNLNILSNVGIDKTSYTNLNDKTSFNAYFKGYAPFVETELSKVNNFVNAFNESIALEELKESADALVIFDKYNGVGTGKYWNLSMGEDSDFAGLSENTQNEILQTVKTSPYTCANDVEITFYEQTGFKFLLETCKQKTDVDNFINNYHDVFDLDISLYNDSELTEYDIADIQNAFLEGIDTIKEVGDISSLYTKSLKVIEGEEDEEDEDDTPSRNNTNGGGFGGSKKPPVVEITEDKEVEIRPLKFYDVALTHWAYTYINKLYDRGIVSGKSETEFAPDGYVTKEEFLKILVGTLGLDAKTGSLDFSDVDIDAWYAPYVYTALDNGIVFGKSDGTLGIGDSLTRQDAAVLISRVINHATVGSTEFTDISEASDYSVDAIKEVSNAGFISGYPNGSFMPLKTITRAESCAILYRLLEYREGLN